MLSAERRRDYHDPARNRANNQPYVDRLMAAQALVVQFPTWSFGPPAMLKGWFDRMFGPGIAMDLSDPGRAKPLLMNIKKHCRDFDLRPPALAGDRHGRSAAQDHQALSALVYRRQGKVSYYALYHMNVATMARPSALRSWRRCADAMDQAFEPADDHQRRCRRRARKAGKPYSCIAFRKQPADDVRASSHRAEISVASKATDMSNQNASR